MSICLSQKTSEWLSVADRFYKIYLDKQLAPYGINSSQHIFLIKICDSPGILQDSLLEMFYVHPNNIERTIAALEKQGNYIPRSACCPRLLKLFGAMTEVFPYAQQYASVTLLGMPFLIVTNGMSSLIRADGSLRYFMACMIIGTIANMLLAPVFIFAFHSGELDSSRYPIAAASLSWYNCHNCYRKPYHRKRKGPGKMDTFMDKFAQRKKAQGMIDANAAADAAKMEKLKGQVNEYEHLLQEMRKVNLRTAENIDKMRRAIQTGIEKLEAFQTENAELVEKDKTLLEIKSQMEELTAVLKEQQSVLSGDVKEQQEKIAGEIKERQEVFAVEMKEQQAALAGEMKEQQKVLTEELKEQQSALNGEVKKQQAAFAEEMKKQLEEAFGQSEESFHKESVKVYRNVQAAMTEELGKQTETLTAAQKESGKKQRAVLPLTVVILLLLLADIAIQLLNFKLF